MHMCFSKQENTRVSTEKDDDDDDNQIQNTTFTRLFLRAQKRWLQL